MNRNYGWVIVGCGLLMTCVAMGAMFSLPVIKPAISQTMGWSDAGVSSAMTIGFPIMGLAGCGWGALSDKIGPRLVVLAGATQRAFRLSLVRPAPNLMRLDLSSGGVCGAWPRRILH